MMIEKIALNPTSSPTSVKSQCLPRRSRPHLQLVSRVAEPTRGHHLSSTLTTPNILTTLTTHTRLQVWSPTRFFCHQSLKFAEGANSPAEIHQIFLGLWAFRPRPLFPELQRTMQHRLVPQHSFDFSKNTIVTQPDTCLQS